MANLYNLCRKNGTVVEYSITAKEVVDKIGCSMRNIYASSCYCHLIQKEYYVEIADRPLSANRDADLLREYDRVRKKILRRYR